MPGWNSSLPWHLRRTMNSTPSNSPLRKLTGSSRSNVSTPKNDKEENDDLADWITSIRKRGKRALENDEDLEQQYEKEMDSRRKSVFLDQGEDEDENEDRTKSFDKLGDILLRYHKGAQKELAVESEPMNLDTQMDSKLHESDDRDSFRGHETSRNLDSKEIPKKHNDYDDSDYESDQEMGFSDGQDGDNNENIHANKSLSERHEQMSTGDENSGDPHNYSNLFQPKPESIPDSSGWPNRNATDLSKNIEPQLEPRGVSSKPAYENQPKDSQNLDNEDNELEDENREEKHMAHSNPAEPEEVVILSSDDDESNQEELDQQNNEEEDRDEDNFDEESVQSSDYEEEELEDDAQLESDENSTQQAGSHGVYAEYGDSDGQYSGDESVPDHPVTLSHAIFPPPSGSSYGLPQQFAEDQLNEQFQEEIDAFGDEHEYSDFEGSNNSNNIDPSVQHQLFEMASQAVNNVSGDIDPSMFGSNNAVYDEQEHEGTTPRQSEHTPFGTANNKSGHDSNIVSMNDSIAISDAEHEHDYEQKSSQEILPSFVSASSLLPKSGPSASNSHSQYIHDLDKRPPELSDFNRVSRNKEPQKNKVDTTGLKRPDWATLVSKRLNPKASIRSLKDVNPFYENEGDNQNLKRYQSMSQIANGQIHDLKVNFSFGELSPSSSVFSPAKSSVEKEKAIFSSNTDTGAVSPSPKLQVESSDASSSNNSDIRTAPRLFRPVGGHTPQPIQRNKIEHSPVKFVGFSSQILGKSARRDDSEDDMESIQPDRKRSRLELNKHEQFGNDQTDSNLGNETDVIMEDVYEPPAEQESDGSNNRSVRLPGPTKDHKNEPESSTELIGSEPGAQEECDISGIQADHGDAEKIGSVKGPTASNGSNKDSTDMVLDAATDAKNQSFNDTEMMEIPAQGIDPDILISNSGELPTALSAVTGMQEPQMEPTIEGIDPEIAKLESIESDDKDDKAMKPKRSTSKSTRSQTLKEKDNARPPTPAAARTRSHTSTTEDPKISNTESNKESKPKKGKTAKAAPKRTRSTAKHEEHGNQEPDSISQHKSEPEPEDISHSVDNGPESDLKSEIESDISSTAGRTRSHDAKSLEHEPLENTAARTRSHVQRSKKTASQDTVGPKRNTRSKVGTKGNVTSTKSTSQSETQEKSKNGSTAKTRAKRIEKEDTQEASDLPPENKKAAQKSPKKTRATKATKNNVEKTAMTKRKASEPKEEDMSHPATDKLEATIESQDDKSVKSTPKKKSKKDTSTNQRSKRVGRRKVNLNK